MVDGETVRRIALELPEASQSGSAFEVNKKGFAWYYQQKIEGQRGRVERLDVLAVRVADLEEKEMLLAMDPEAFFTDAHYNGYPAVLVRLAAVDIDDLSELLVRAWRTRAPRKLVAQFDADEKSASEPTVD